MPQHLAHHRVDRATCVARGMPPSLWVAGPAQLRYGIGLASMFAPLHECVQRTAFKTNTLNDGVGWFAGLLSFYNSTCYRHHHGWRRRFTQIPGTDPELEDAKPTSVIGYLIEISGLTWWSSASFLDAP